MPERPLPVLIDTDIGDDIDDALALAFALASPELDVRAVTTVYGPVDVRTRLALKVLSTCGRDDVPVATGRAEPLFGQPRVTTANQAAVLEEGERPPEPCPDPADEVILRAADEAQGQLTIITIGAMTNLAVALLREPDLAERARLIAMGGAFGRNQAEWNISCDPEAARVCVSSGMPALMVGLDVTTQCQMPLADVERIATAGTPRTELLARLIRAWQGTADGEGKGSAPVLHDPLAVAVAFQPSLVETEACRVSVETRGEFTRGYTVARPGGAVEVCRAVQAEAFLGLFMDRVVGD